MEFKNIKCFRIAPRGGECESETVELVHGGWWTVMSIDVNREDIP